MLHTRTSTNTTHTHTHSTFTRGFADESNNIIRTRCTHGCVHDEDTSHVHDIHVALFDVVDVWGFSGCDNPHIALTLHLSGAPVTFIFRRVSVTQSDSIASADTIGPPLSSTRSVSIVKVVRSQDDRLTHTHTHALTLTHTHTFQLEHACVPAAPDLNTPINKTRPKHNRIMCARRDVLSRVCRACE